MAAGFLLWFVFYLVRMIGAGDVKLFAACAVWLGPLAALQAAFWTALVGGVMAVIVLIVDGGIGRTVLQLATAFHSPHVLRERQTTRAGRLPYAVAIAVGVVLTILLPRPF